MTRLTSILIAVVTLLPIGCRAPSSSQPQTDSTLVRYSKAGQKAYAEGYLDDAMDEYRSALLRAWAIDDPYESGTVAYNIAACMTSRSQTQMAKAWLIEARVELCRAKSSVGNVWLLEAKIASDECRFEDATRYLCRAECTEPPCNREEGGCLCGPKDPCRQSCVTKIPCVGEKVATKKALKQCEKEFQAQIHLSRAAIAAEQYDLDTAMVQFQCACELAADVCSHDLQAQLQHVAGLIHLVKDEHLQAGWHFDKEAKHLRLAGNYREIPPALESAAAAFEQARRFDLAVSRMCRVARIWLGRGDARQAWEYLQAASQLSEMQPCDIAEVRLAIVAREIERFLADEPETDDLMIEAPAQTDPKEFQPERLPQPDAEPVDSPI